MRFLLTAIIALSLISASAFAAESNVNTSKPEANFVPALPATTQPDSMKVIPGSGGVSTSYIVKDAPLKDD